MRCGDGDVVWCGVVMVMDVVTQTIGKPTHVAREARGQLLHQRRRLLGASGGQNRGFWWVVIDLEGDLDADERVKRVGTSLRVK